VPSAQAGSSQMAGDIPFVGSPAVAPPDYPLTGSRSFQEAGLLWSDYRRLWGPMELPTPSNNNQSRLPTFARSFDGYRPT
jgi:hypothetical protein